MVLHTPARKIANSFAFSLAYSYLCKAFCKTHKMEHIKLDCIMALIHSKNTPLASKIYIGHLRYSTTGKRALSFIHPFNSANKNIYQ